MSWRILAVALSLVLAAALLVPVLLRTQPASSREVVRLAVADLPVLALVHIAEGKKLFQKHGVDVRSLNFSTGRDALVAVVNDEADLATVFDTAFVLQVLNGQDLGILCSLHTSQSNTALVARGDRGITKPKDLRGKKVAVSPGTSAEYFLYLFLETNGILRDEVQVVKAENDRALGLLEQGKVDAIAVWEPHLYELKSHPPPALDPVFLYSDVYREFSLLAGRRTFLREHSSATIPVLRALLEADLLVAEKPEEAFEILRQHFPQATPDSLRGAWNRSRFTLALSSTLLLNLDQQAQLLSERLNLPPPLPNFRRLMELEALSQVNAEAVTVLPQVPR